MSRTYRYGMDPSRALKNLRAEPLREEQRRYLELEDSSESEPPIFHNGRQPVKRFRQGRTRQ